MGLDGHELAVVSTVSGGYMLFNRSLPKGWVRGFIHRQPVAAMAVFWGLVGITLPLVVPRMRRMVGWPTNQYDAAHPKCVGPNYKY